MSPSSTDRHLTLDDIEDLRQYERSREQFRQRIIALKRLRRISIGPLVTVVFENRDTVRFQIQEMARVEKMASDDQIRAELDVYNPLIPGPGELSATLFIELIDEAALRRWLPQLVGIERALQLRVGGGSDIDVVPSTPEASHEEQLTREDVTASVHYIRFSLSAAQVDRFAAGPAVLAVALAAYEEQTVLEDDVRVELLGDLRP